jgi:predicted dehydrogenase
MRHLKALRSLDNVLPVAVPYRRTRLGQLKEAGFEVAGGLNDAAGQGATMCVIASDPGRHVEDGLQALDLGLHVLMEKPLATNAIDAVRLVKLARQVDRTLFVACTLRFSDSLNRFRELMSQVGRVNSVRIACQSYLPNWRPHRDYRESYSARAGEGGVLLDLIHEIDYSGWIFGWPQNVRGVLKNTGALGIASEELADLTWETTEGCAISTNLDYLTRAPLRRAIASGYLGTLAWDGIQRKVTLTLTSQNPEEFPSAQGVDEMFSLQARAFIDACAAEPDPRLATGEDGIRSLAVCDAARRSSASGVAETVSLPEGVR